MSGKAKEKLKSTIKRKRLNNLMEAGMSLSAAAKRVGISYAHAKNIIEPTNQRSE